MLMNGKTDETAPSDRRSMQRADFFSLGSSGIMISNLMLFINTLVECVILLGQGRRRYDNAFIVKFSMLYANYIVVSFSKFYHGVSSSI